MDGAASWYKGFWDLNSDRQVGLKVGRIPFTAARSYAQSWSQDEFDAFWQTLRAMDDVYLAHVNDDKPKTFTRESFRSAFSGR